MVMQCVGVLATELAAQCDHMLIKTWTIRHTTPIRRKASFMHKKPWEDAPYVNIEVTLVRTAPKLGHHVLGAVSLLDLGRRCIGRESSYVMWR